MQGGSGERGEVTGGGRIGEGRNMGCEQGPGSSILGSRGGNEPQEAAVQHSLVHEEMQMGRTSFGMRQLRSEYTQYPTSEGISRKEALAAAALEFSAKASGDSSVRLSSGIVPQSSIRSQPTQPK